MLSENEEIKEYPDRKRNQASVFNSSEGLSVF